MKKKVTIFAIMIMIMIVLAVYGRYKPVYTSTTSTFLVIEKNKDTTMRIFGKDVYSNEKFTIYIDDSNVWNLIIENQKYNILYEQYEGQNKKLQLIEMIN